jgi:hypothetical protein
MPSSRALNGIASGLVGTFVSRNNDVAGYWGIGQIQREIEGGPHSVVELDLVHARAMPDGPVARELIAHYMAYLTTLLARCGFTHAAITGAKVFIEFGMLGVDHAPGFAAMGSPFNCKVVLVSTSGKMFSAVRAGHSWAHNPERELRSARVQ